MNIAEWHISFKQGMDKFDSLNYPNLEPEQIDLLFNQAIGMFVKQRYGYNNSKKESFEETQKRTEDLKTLVKTSVIVPLTNNVNNIDLNSNFIDIPIDHWITIFEKANITYLNCNSVSTTEDVEIIPIQHNDYNKIINNPFAKPTTDKVLRLVTQEGIELLHSSDSTINNYKLRYIKEPAKVDLLNNVDCDLTPMVHDEIISLAISIALENIEAERIKTYPQVVENRNE